jgi:hypothetical protein
MTSRGGDPYALSPPYHALCFDQVSDAVKIKAKHADVLQQPDNLTFSMWIHPTNIAAAPPHSKKYYLSVNVINSYALYCCERRYIRVAFRNEKPGWKWIQTNIQIPPNQWTHIAVTYNAQKREANVFKDGTFTMPLAVQGQLEANGKNLAIRIMEHSADEDDPNQDGQDRFTGMISHLKIWKAVLTESQMREQITNMDVEHQLSDLVGWWKFDEGYGDNVFDATGNVPQGKVIGARWWIAPNLIGCVLPSTLAADFKQIFNSPLGSDVTLAVEGHTGPPIYAHRIILASRSDTFKAMLFQGMSESTQKDIVFKDISFSILSLLVEYLYTDTVEVNAQNVVDLFVAADKFQVNRLRSICENFFFQNISEENVCNVLELADRFHARQLRQYCVNWILSNFGEMLKNDDYLNLNKDLLAEINKQAAQRYFTSNKKRKV